MKMGPVRCSETQKCDDLTLRLEW